MLRHQLARTDTEHLPAAAIDDAVGLDRQISLPLLVATAEGNFIGGR
jgi:hypothetical protein